jgi:hypothetical protein
LSGMFPEMSRKLFWQFFVTRPTCPTGTYNGFTSQKSANLRL